MYIYMEILQNMCKMSNIHLGILKSLKDSMYIENLPPSLFLFLFLFLVLFLFLFLSWNRSIMHVNNKFHGRGQDKEEKRNGNPYPASLSHSLYCSTSSVALVNHR